MFLIYLNLYSAYSTEARSSPNLCENAQASSSELSSLIAIRHKISILGAFF